MASDSDRRTIIYGRVVVLADRLITFLTVLSYILVLFLYYQMGVPKLIEAMLIPGISFIIVSIFRKVYNAPRPYEVRQIKALTGKKTKGQSMPSRHTFSIFIIAMTVLYYDYRFGLCLLIAGVVLAMLRVIERVHFVRDVVAGAMVGVLTGLLYFCLPV